MNTAAWLLIISINIQGGYGTIKGMVPAIASEEECHRIADVGFGYNFRVPFGELKRVVPEHRCIPYRTVALPFEEDKNVDQK